MPICYNNHCARESVNIYMHCSNYSVYVSLFTLIGGISQMEYYLTAYVI